MYECSRIYLVFAAGKKSKMLIDLHCALTDYPRRADRDCASWPILTPASYEAHSHTGSNIDAYSSILCLEDQAPYQEEYFAHHHYCAGPYFDGYESPLLGGFDIRISHRL